MNALLKKILNEKQTTGEYEALLSRIERAAEDDPFHCVVELDEARETARGWLERASIDSDDAMDNVTMAQDRLAEEQVTEQDVINAKATAWDVYWRAHSVKRLYDDLQKIYEHICNLLANWGKAEFREQFEKRRAEEELLPF